MVQATCPNCTEENLDKLIEKIDEKKNLALIELRPSFAKDNRESMLKVKKTDPKVRPTGHLRMALEGSQYLASLGSGGAVMANQVFRATRNPTDSNPST